MIDVQIIDGCTIFNVTGEVTANDIMMQAVQYMQGKQTPTSIWDFTQTVSVKITTLEMKGIADSLKNASPGGKSGKVALVGSRTTNIGLGKLFTAFAEMAGLPYTYKVFRDITHAKEWLAGHLGEKGRT